MHAFTLEPAPGLCEMLQLALDEEEASGGAVALEVKDPVAREQLVLEAAGLLEGKKEMLSTYFGIGLGINKSINRDRDEDEDEDEDTGVTGAAGGGSSNGSSSGIADIAVTSLPRLVDGHTPCMDWLPAFLLELALQVEWDEEAACFQSLALALGRFYARVPDIPDYARPVPRGALGGTEV